MKKKPVPENQSLLDQIKISAPCPANWEQMEGSSDEVRFCHQCHLHVCNLSAMTRQEALSLIQRTDGRLCARIYQRHDGTVITSNCPQGLRIIKQRLLRFAGATLALLLSIPAWLTNTNAAPVTQSNPGRQTDRKSNQRHRRKRIKREIAPAPTMGALSIIEVPPLPALLTINPRPPVPATIEMPPPPPLPEKER